MAKQPNWNERELQILKDNYILKSKNEILKLLPQRRWNGILHKTSRLKLIGRKNTNKFRGYNSKYKLNENFFKEWNENSAYIFGRLITDGSWRLRKNGGDVRIKSIDKENLEKIRFIMGSTHKIRKERNKGNLIYVFDIFNNEIVRDLNFLENNLQEIISNKQFFNDFLRGVIDGDGSLNFNNGHLRITIASISKSFLDLLRKRIDFGKLYSKSEKDYVLHFNTKEADQICEMIYRTQPFLYLARKFSRWELWRRMKQK